MSFFLAVYDALMCNVVEDKLSAVEGIEIKSEHLTEHTLSIKQILVPGRPAKPLLVLPKELPKRKLGSTDGVLVLAHAIAHIEFNAINLALDAIYRFKGMPVQYYKDWLKVAKEEAKHFTLLNNFLTLHNKQYGDYPAHNGLWDMAVKTDHCIITRMALVPRLLEARGLDVTPGIINKLKKINEHKLVEILEVIMFDEVGHVKIGNYWYDFLCEKNKLDKIKNFEYLLNKYAKGFIRKPFSYDLRLKAGFSLDELEALEVFC